MGTLRPNVNEVGMKRRDALEYFKLHGVPGQVYEIDTKNTNVYNDDDHSYKEPRNVPVIFQQYPDVRTLKKIGWYQQDQAELPWILYIPFMDEQGIPIQIQNNVKVSVALEHSFDQVETLKVKKVAGKGFSAMYWVVNVVPIYEEEPKLDPTDEDKDGFSFLNRK